MLLSRLGLFHGRLTALVAGAILGCGGTDLLLPGDNQPAALAVVQGNHQNAQVGAPLPDPIVVRATDATGRPVAGAQVTFRLTSPAGGELTPGTAITDNSGQASAQWSLGNQAGAQTAEARVEASGVAPLQFTAFAAAGVPSRLELVSGDGQTAPVGMELAESLIVRTTDHAGNPVEGVGVSWSSPDGGSVGAPATPTGADGRAGTRRTLGPAAGQQATLAAVDGLVGSPVTFSATATTGDAGKLMLVVQPSSTATNGQAFAEQPSVRLVDAFNNPVSRAGVAVTVAVDGNPSTVALNGQRTVPTDESGVAAFSGLSLTGQPGNYALRFSGASLADIVSRVIQLQPGAVSSTRSSVSAAPGSIVVTVESATMTVTLRDQFGFPVPGVTVVPSASPASGSFAPASAATSASGVATFSFSSATAGEYQLSAAAGSAQLTQTAAVRVAKALTTTSITSDNPDPSGLIQSVAVAFSVQSAIGQPLGGTVTVRENEGRGICSAPVAAGSCAIWMSGVGRRTLTATYEGDAVHEASSSAAEPHDVQLFAP
jgi:adhesin/invasin